MKGQSPIALLNAHPANGIMSRLMAYGSTKDILAVNCFEVLRFIEEIESGRFSDMAFDETQRWRYREFENHLIRYFHNFLAAAKTLVDHTRNLMKSDVITEPHRKAYQEKVNSLFGDDTSKFIMDFRNYTLHYGVPHLSHIYTFEDEKWQVSLNLSEIKHWDGWTAKSREFFAKHPDQIRLSWPVATYQQKSLNLHEWIIMSFNDFYREVFQDFDKLRATFLGEQSQQDR